jgi:hypothetical protein
MSWRYVFGIIAIGPLLAGVIVFLYIKPLTDNKWHSKISSMA